MTKATILKNVISLYAFILVVWGFYRFLFKLPETVEELILKPLIWLVPLVFFLGKQKKGVSSVGWTSKNLFFSIYLGIGLGALMSIEAVFLNSIKYGGSIHLLAFPQQTFWGAIGLSFATAFSEETVFRGFIFNRLQEALKNEWIANGITSIGWMIMHIPVTIFVLKYSTDQSALFLLLTLLFGIVSAFVFARTKNIIAPVLLSVFWGWPVILFR